MGTGESFFQLFGVERGPRFERSARRFSHL